MPTTEPSTAHSSPPGFYGNLSQPQTDALAILLLAICQTLESPDALYLHAGKYLTSERLGPRHDPAARARVLDYIRIECHVLVGMPCDSMILRFLRARKWSPENAYKMLFESMNFRVENDTMRIRQVGDAGGTAIYPPELYYISVFGVAKSGHPVMYFDASKHVRGAFPQSKLLEFLIYCSESMRLALRYPIENFTIVFDLGNFGLKNIDLDGMRLLINSLQNNYPECLNRILVIDSPFIFKGAWAVISPILDPVVTEKITFIARKELANFIEPSQTPRSFGGTSDYTFDFTCQPEMNTKISESEYEAARLELLQGAMSLSPYIAAWAYRTVKERGLCPLLDLPKLNTCESIFVAAAASASKSAATSTGKNSESNFKWDPVIETMPLNQLNELRLEKERQYIFSNWMSRDARMRYPSIWQRMGIVSYDKV